MPASLWRRLGAVLYDTMIIFSVLMLAGLIWLFATGFEKELLQTIYYKVYLFLVILGFFTYFWKRGQTLGMMAWKIKLTQADGQLITTKQAILRFFLGLLVFPTLGLTYFTVLLDPQNRALHDMFSGTVLVKCD